MRLKTINLKQYIIVMSIIITGCMTSINAELVINGTNSFHQFIHLNPGKSLNPLLILSFKWGKINLLIDGAIASVTDSILSTVPAKLGDPPLVYPNPFTLNEGANIGYSLTRDDMDIEIRVYDMKGYEIKRKAIQHGQKGAMLGYNKVTLNESFFGHNNMPAGIYFYILLHNNEFLGKGKFAIAP